MAAEAELEDELRRLRAAMPQLTGAFVVDHDGKVIAKRVTGPDTPSTGARTADALTAALRLAEATATGTARELLIRGDQGWLVGHAAGRLAVLMLATEPRANIGRLRIEARRSSSRIGELLDGAFERLEKT
ncbi:roadblock/LC7 domain-containing protein [Streptomyces sp. KLOTTS4A1]|uniref:roadblock/LC7 domain-containing protein n=1 Tax=Streptomyces sp. KLOTTS4A1 TaxID=3390996 RepID=UPI0039F5B7AB